MTAIKLNNYYPQLTECVMRYKKKLTDYGYQVGKISMKEQTVIFQKTV